MKNTGINLVFLVAGSVVLVLGQDKGNWADLEGFPNGDQSKCQVEVTNKSKMLSFPDLQNCLLTNVTGA